jgi:hypothetical protein
MGSTDNPGRGDETPQVDLTPHPLVQSATEGGDGPDEDVTTLVGFIGAAAADDRVRIYLGLSFASYCEVGAADVVRTAPVDPKDEQSPSIVWIKSSADVRLIGRLTGTASFISGAIRSRYLPGATRATSVMADTAPVCSELFFCRSEDPCSTPLCPVKPASNWECVTDKCPPPSQYFC